MASEQDVGCRERSKDRIHQLQRTVDALAQSLLEAEQEKRVTEGEIAGLRLASRWCCHLQCQTLVNIPKVWFVLLHQTLVNILKV